MTCSTNEEDDVFTILQGESKTWELYVTTLSKTAQNLDGVQVWMTIKARYEDTTPLVQKRTENAGGAAGEIIIATPQSTAANTGRCNIQLNPADTRNLKHERTYVMDVWVKLSNGQHRPVLRNKTLTIKPAVTQIPL